MPDTPTIPKMVLSSRSRETRDRHDRIMLRQYARTQDPALREALIERFMPLARSLAWRYSSTGEPMEDLIQVAAEGLVKAIDGYDISRPNGFSSYATPVILGGLRHYFRDSTQPVHVPRGLQERIQKVNVETDRVGSDLGRRATSEEVATRTEMSIAEVEEAMAADSNRRPISIDMPSRPQADETQAPLAEAIGSEETGFERVEATLAAESAPLDDNEREALHLRFEHSLNQREIGERIGVSQMQVSRLLRRALNKLLVAMDGETAERLQAAYGNGNGKRRKRRRPAPQAALH